MGKLRTGPASYLTRCSKGAETGKFNFYSTRYSTSYGDVSFDSRTPRHKGTGYLANFRTGVYYTPSLDVYDNPYVGRLLQDNYSSTYSKYHTLFCGSNGTDMLPSRLIRNESGFTETKPITTAHSKAFYNNRMSRIYEDFKPKPLLHKLQQKRIPHLDTATIPFETEVRASYQGEPSSRMNIHQKDVGKKEESGFTHYCPMDPVQGLHPSPHVNETVYRPIETTLHQEKYQIWSDMTGAEMNPGVRNRSKRETGYSFDTAHPHYLNRVPNEAFTRMKQLPGSVIQNIAKNDPSEYINIQRGADNSTMAQNSYQGKQSNNVKASDRSSTSNQEASGYSENNRSFVDRRDSRNFITNYDVKYGSLYNSHKHRRDPFASKKRNGFTKSTKVDSYGDGRVFREREMEVLHPMIAGQAKLENPCYTDAMRNAKIRTSI